MYKKDRFCRKEVRATEREIKMLERIAKDMSLSHTEVIWRAVETYYSQRYKKGKFICKKDI